jgi:hypothetical protein
MSTIPERRVPVVVLVAPAPLLFDACREVCQFAGVTSMEVTDVHGAATNIARWRPFVMILEEDVYDFDPAEFDALARDVGAEIIAVPAGGDYNAIVGALLPVLKNALRRWEEQGDMTVS